MGSNSSNPQLNYVNSYPVTAIKYGIKKFGPDNFEDCAAPDLVVTGPNVSPTLRAIAASDVEIYLVIRLAPISV